MKNWNWSTKSKINNIYTKGQMMEKKIKKKGHKFLFGCLNWREK